jgi:hypothetical protein
MKKIIKLITILLLTFTTSCKSQSKQTEFSIKDFEFKSIFATKKVDSLSKIVHFSQVENMYCLLGQGFFKAPSSDNADELLNKWLTDHPNAKLIPISILKSQPKMTYCWVISDTENLNLFLVKNGCYPAGTMQRPKKWKEMSKKEKKVFRGIGKPKVQVLVDDKIYESFIEELKLAELYAKENKLGIWNEKKNKASC